ncbi:MAG: CHAT domain-containing protein [Phaeodactylibacter sp.]|nr:CHAT domain-containing protein [Phaeodactylibacter sp.]
MRFCCYALCGLLLLLAIPLSAQEAEDWYRNGMEAKEQEQYHRAAACFEKAKELYPREGRYLAALEAGICRHRANNTRLAQPLLAEACRLAEGQFGSRSPEHTRARLELADTYLTEGRPAEAISLLAPLAPSMKNKGEAGLHARLHLTLGQACFQAWQYEKAEAHLEKALALHEKGGALHPFLACRLYTTLALFQKEKGIMDKHYYHREKARDALRQIRPDRLEWAQAAAGLTLALPPRQAAELLVRADSLSVRHLGEHSIGSAVNRIQLASYQPYPEEGQRLMETAAAIIRDSLGARSISYAHIINGLGINALSRQLPARAAELFLEVRAIYQEAALSAEEPAWAVTLENLAAARAAAGNCDTALLLFDQGLAWREASFGRNSLPYAAALNNAYRDQCLEGRGQKGAILELIREREGIFRALGNAPGWQIDIAWQYGNYFSGAKDNEKSIEWHKEAYRLAGEILEKENSTAALIATQLGYSYANSQQPAEAQRWQLKAAAHWKEADGALPALQQAKLLDRYYSLRWLNEQLGRYDSAAAYLELTVQYLDEKASEYPSKLMAIALTFTNNGNWERGRRYFREAQALIGQKRREGRFLPQEEQYYLGYPLLFYVSADVNCDSAAFYLQQYSDLIREYFPENKQNQVWALSLLHLKLHTCDAVGPDSLARVLEQRLVLYEQHFPGNTAQLLNDLAELSRYYQEEGRLEQARSYGGKVLGIYREIAAKNPGVPALELDYLDYKAYFEQRFIHLDSALSTVRQALSLAEAAGLAPKQALLHNRMGILYDNKGAYEQAIEAYRRAIALDSNDYNYKMNLVHTLSTRQAFEEAGVLLEKLLSDPQGKASLSRQLSTLKTTGRLYRKMGRYDKALQYYFEAVDMLGGRPERKPDIPNTRPNIRKLHGYYSLIAYTYLLYHEQDGRRQWLEEALRYSRFARQALEASFGSQPVEQAREQLLLGDANYEDDPSSTYEDAVRIHLAFYRLEGRPEHLREAYRLMEEGRARHFKQLFYRRALAQAEDAQARRLGALEQQIISQYGKLEEASEKFKGQEDQSALRLIDEEITRLQREREVLLRASEELQGWFSPSRATVEEVQRRLLRPGQSLLQYALSDSFLITALLQTDTFLLDQRPCPPGLKQDIETFRREAGSANMLLDSFALAAYRLYAGLLAPYEGILGENLVIIPSAELFYLPFEALLTEPLQLADGFEEMPFLLKRHNVSYGLSADILLDQGRPGGYLYGLDMLAVAPSYEGRSDGAGRAGFRKLEYSREEAETALGQYPGKPERKRLLEGTAASRESFEASLRLRPAAIHYAGHAHPNDQAGHRSFLALTGGAEDAYLYAGEIMGPGRELPARMVVLSGCNTNQGSLRKGEGIIGLQYAFSIAGAQSLIASLWAVDDQATRQLFARFYQLLSQGDSKHYALRQARLELLQEGKAPYYWAAFTAFGNMAPLF